MKINVLEYLECSAANSPEKVVFKYEKGEVTYKELLFKARAIGSFILTRTDNVKNQPIMVLIDRDLTSLIAFMGIVYSGNFYVPVDGNLPTHRIQSMIDTLNPIGIVTRKVNEVTLSPLSFSGQKWAFEEMEKQKIAVESLSQVRGKAIDNDPLYAMFTSGSTGTPKGVLISHRSVINLIEQFSSVFGFSNDTRFGNQAPFDFDVSVKDIYSTLKHGATMYVIPKTFFSFPGQLIHFLNDHKINTIIWATSALRIVENLKALEKEKPAYLRQVMFSGEVMPNKVLNYWRKHLPDVQYINLYGPTEITCNCSYFMVDRYFSDDELLPIGKPFPNTEILVLNENNEMIQEDELGEICVRGTSLGLGYYNNPAETARGFCQNPLNSRYPQLIYRTGDLGRYNDRHELIFLSRKDNQIKHMGHRIELGEIEVAANSLGFIDAACCLYDHDAEKIILFYQADKKCDIEVLQGLKQYFPKYMLPNKLIHYHQLPMNKNAKIDRNRLREIHLSGTGK